MKKLINRPEDVVKEELAGMLAAHSDLIRVDIEQQIIVRRDAPIKGKVGVISGGGSGHEPSRDGRLRGGGTAEDGGGRGRHTTRPRRRRHRAVRCARARRPCRSSRARAPSGEVIVPPAA